MSIGIYKIENLINHKIYIGQSIHIERRWCEHCQQSNNSLIAKAIKKYGKENFSFQILEECDQLNLSLKEEEYIKKYNSLVPNGYNMVSIDDGINQVFYNYSLETLLNIIDDIKFTNLTFKDIASKYSLDISMIYYINRGDYHTQANEKYPLRQVKDFSKQHNFCVSCGKEINLYATRCVQCSKIHSRIVQRPNREELKNLIRNLPFTQIGKIYNVSDNAVRKWCIIENLPNKKSEIKKYSTKQWEQI